MPATGRAMSVARVASVESRLSLRGQWSSIAEGVEMSEVVDGDELDEER